LAGRAAENLADELEFTLLVAASAALSNAAAATHLAETAGAEAADVELALKRMEWRGRMLGEKYPFHVKEVGISRRSKIHASQAYAGLLLLSARAAPFRRTDADFAHGAVIFERLVAVATEALLGSGSTAVRFAWPSDQGRPPEFPDAVRWLARRMEIAIGGSYRPPRRQDGGVDIVTWRSFGDRRPGFPILLTQSTLQRDYVAKSADIDVRLWAGYLRFDVDPQTALAVPFDVVAGEDWNEMATRTIVLDRIRLAALVAPDAVPSPVADWVSSQIATARASSIG
jgi:hypothetical protein